MFRRTATHFDLVRPIRYAYSLIKQTREFVVNIPAPEQSTLTDYIGIVTGREENKIALDGLKLAPALKVKTPVLADCPVNIECIVEREIERDSHTMFIGLCRQYTLKNRSWMRTAMWLSRGIAYDCGTVRE